MIFKKVLFGVLLSISFGAFAESNLEIAESVKAEVQGEILYPGISRQRSEEGTVLIQIKDGNASIYKSSGYEALDIAALKATKRSEKVTSLTGEVILPVIFKLVSK